MRYRLLVRFWDTSALVPLYVEEPASAACRDLYLADPAVAAWAVTRTEAMSAIWRRRRAGELDEAAVRGAVSRLEAHWARWYLVSDLPSVEAMAARAVVDHPLRAADAMQLAAAMHFSGGRPDGLELVTRDVRLAAACALEGFTTIVPGPAGAEPS